MLLSCILQILDRFLVPPKTAEIAEIKPFATEFASASEAIIAEKLSDLKEKGSDTALKLELQPSSPMSAQSMDYFIRAITKFNKQEQRVVDVFE
jgi:hypothetical protein